MTTSTGDAETIRRLRQAVEARRGDFAAWQRLGERLAARRWDIAPKYAHNGRERFARERGEPHGLDGKFLYELEHGPRWGRKGFPASRMPAVAAAYGVTLESVIAVLGDPAARLEPAPAGRLAAAPDPAPAPPLDDDIHRQVASGQHIARLSGVLSDAALAAATPHVIEILLDLRDLAVSGIMRPSGRQLFADSDEDAAIWDRNADEMPDGELAMLIAGRRVLEASARTGQDRTAGLTGWTAAAPALCPAR